jgi:RNA-directed DNA polymerase
MLGIPTFEDKVAQRAVTMVLEDIYEQDFLPCSYGFRPGRCRATIRMRGQRQSG